MPRSRSDATAAPCGLLGLGRRLAFPGEERAGLWRKHNDQYAGFDEYEERTDRDIAVFVLDPR